jgi:hypothetical protein
MLTQETTVLLCQQTNATLCWYYRPTEGEDGEEGVPDEEWWHAIRTEVPPDFYFYLSLVLLTIIVCCCLRR